MNKYPVGGNWLPNYQDLDLHVDRRSHVETTNILPKLDVFNVMNSSTIQAIRGTQNAANANQIQAILAPRVIRCGVKFNWASALPSFLHAIPVILYS